MALVSIKRNVIVSDTKEHTRRSSVSMHYFYYRATLCVGAVFADARTGDGCPSVRPSARLSRPCIASRRLKISSNFFLGPVAPLF